MNHCKTEMEAWRVQSPEVPGFHAVITPDQSACQKPRIFCLNLPKGERCGILAAQQIIDALEGREPQHRRV